jgi:hypothetical protein
MQIQPPKRKQIAPRLASGESRVAFGHGLPETVKEGLRGIAHKEGQSMSWVMEQVIIDYFGLRAPRYVKPKPIKAGGK